MPGWLRVWRTHLLDDKLLLRVAARLDEHGRTESALSNDLDLLISVHRVHSPDCTAAIEVRGVDLLSWCSRVAAESSEIPQLRRSQP